MLLGMNKFSSVLLSWRQLGRNKLRSALTIFGITIGIAVVIIVLSAGNGVKGLILGEVAAFGDNWINVEVKVPSTGKASAENAQSQARGVTITTLTLGDAEAIATLDNVETFYAGVTTQAVFSYQNEKKQPMIFAVTEEFISIDAGSEIASGRFYSKDEGQSLAQVVVLGSDLKETLFGNAEAVGSTIKVDGRSFRVIGVMKERGSTGFFNWDEVAFLPLQTAQKKLMGIDHILFLIAKIHDSTIAETTAEEIRWLMRERHDITDPDKDDFAVTTQQESIELIDTVFFGIQTLLVVLAGISLIVGGVGIMNVMYVSVVERTFEIGLRKSVGATQKQIQNQFLIEAVVLTCIGGVIGIVAGIGISFIVSIVARQYGFNWDFIVSFPSIVIGTTFSIAVGLGFGFFPAKKAALLDPIDALRQE